MTRFQWQGVHKAVCTTIVVGLKPFELTGLLAIGTSDGLTGGITREATQTIVHLIGLQPVLRGQELDIQSCLTSQLCWYGLVQPDGNLYCLAFGCHHDTAVEVIVIIAQGYLDATVLFVDLTAGHLWHQVPLLRGVVQTNGSTLYGTNPVMNHLDTRIFLVVKAAIETIAEHQHVHTLAFKILKVVKR